MKCSRVETQNAIREASKFMNRNSREAHAKHMCRVIKYLVKIHELGLFLEPNKKLDGCLDFEFTVEGRSDCGHANDPRARKGVCGYVT